MRTRSLYAHVASPSQNAQLMYLHRVVTALSSRQEAGMELEALQEKVEKEYRAGKTTVIQLQALNPLITVLIWAITGLLFRATSCR